MGPLAAQAVGYLFESGAIEVINAVNRRQDEEAIRPQFGFGLNTDL
jgi:hypothetical protein